jgi:hypothetical protein
LAAAAKQTGFAWAGLALSLGVVQAASLPRHCSRLARQVVTFVLGFCLIATAVVVWDWVRIVRGGAGFWQSGVESFGGLRLIWTHELGPRLRGWARFLYLAFASPVLAGVLLIGLPALVGNRIWRGDRAPQALLELLIAFFCLTYLLVHWLLAFPVWDRYLLPLVPLLAVLVACLVSLLARTLPGVAVRRAVWIVCQLSLVATLALPAADASRSRYPVGGDHGAYDGVDQVATFLRALPEGAVVYHHWLGWHFRYHLFPATVYLAYWPTPEWLAQDVRAFGSHGPRYISFPSWERPERVQHALASVGYGLEPVLETRRRDGTWSIAVYRILKAGEL